MWLDTHHLKLMPCTPEHLLGLMRHPEDFAELTGFSVAEGLRDFFVSAEVSPEWLAQLEKSSGPDPWRYGFFVLERGSGTAIGTAGFKGPPDAEVVEIAYGIVPAFEGKGYATEAAGALVEFALASGKVRVVRAHTLPERNVSGRVLEKCGFGLVGEVVDPEDGPVWRWEWSAPWAERHPAPARPSSGC